MKYQFNSNYRAYTSATKLRPLRYPQMSLHLDFTLWVWLESVIKTLSLPIVSQPTGLMRHVVSAIIIDQFTPSDEFCQQKQALSPYPIFGDIDPEVLLI